MSHPPRVPLSIGASTATKVAVVILAVIMIGIAGFVALIAIGFAYGARTAVRSSLNDGSWHVDEDGKLAPGPGAEAVDGVGIAVASAGSLCAFVFLLLSVYLILRVVRTGAWLEGTVLHLRSALRTKQVDLAKASISGGTRHEPVGERHLRTVEIIRATDPATGKTVTLPLRGSSSSSMLPAEQLRMLANAITNQRVRSGPDDPAFVVAEHLRRFASDPFA